MRMLLHIVLIFMLTAASSYATEQDGCGHDCTRCHSISKSSAQKVLKQIISDKSFQVLDVKPAVNGIYKIEFEQNAQKGILYMDYGMKNLFVGFIIPVEQAVAVSKSQNSKSVPEKVQIDKLLLGRAITAGNSNAKKMVVVFSDPDCPYCAMLHREIKKIVSKNDNVQFKIVMMPNEKIHPGSYKKALSVVCNGSLDILEKAYLGDKLPEPNCQTNYIDLVLDFARKNNITATPTMVMPSGKVVTGFLSAEEIENAL